MKKLWARYLTVAGLGCLLALWALPASAYYPPLQATANWGWPWNWVSRTVYDPKLQKNQDLTSQWGGPDIEIVDLKQQNGVISWIFRNGATYFVYYSVYDPDLAKFNEDIQGPFSGVTRFTVNDGVVAYVAAIPPSGTSPGYPDVRYATYDPSYAKWMHGKTSNWWGGLDKISISDLIVKDGVMLYRFSDLGWGDYCRWSIYDPKRGIWTWEPLYGTGIGTLGYAYISDATVYLCPPPDHDPNEGIYGYDHDGLLGSAWYNYPTKPMAYFVARPKIGTSPMWVWFTDMSIAATTWNWNFDDNNTSTSRSPYHTFTSAGTFWVSQQISGPNGSNTYTDPIIVAYPIVLKKSITGVLYLLLLAD